MRDLECTNTESCCTKVQPQGAGHAEARCALRWLDGRDMIHGDVRASEYEEIKVSSRRYRPHAAVEK